MTTTEFLSYLRGRDVKVWADNGQLCCDAPQGALTPALRKELKERKEEILTFLHAAAASRDSSEPILQPISRAGRLPLSFAQQRLWFLEQWEPGGCVYNIPAAFCLTGALNVAALEHSVNEIVRRHEALRTTFTAVDGDLVEVIAPALALEFPLVDLGNLPEGEREAAAKRLAVEEAQRPFDLVNGPLLRITLLRLGEQEHVLLLNLHHIASDGWSLGVLFRELASLYEAYCAGKTSSLLELPIQYADFAVWQRQWLQGEVLESQISYWRRQLGNGGSVLELPTDHPRPPVETFHGAQQTLVLTRDLSEQLKELSRREQVTLFMTLLAAFKVLLHRYSGQDDIVVGSPIAGRNRAELEGLMGFFINTLVLRTDLSGDPTFRDLLGRVREVALGAYEHQDLPFEKLVEELQPQRDLSRSPLFQVMFVLPNVPGLALELPGLKVKAFDVQNGTAKFDLTLTVLEEQGVLRAVFEYNTDLFEAGTAARMLGHWRNLLEGIVADPDRRLHELPLLSGAERDQVLVEWNDTQRDYPTEKCIHELFEAQVERTPDAVAVAYEDRQLTYWELNRRANQLAHYLRKQGVGPEVLVGICVERSLEMVVGVLGILKAGGAYVPLDPAYPKERLAFMLKDSHAPILLTEKKLFEALSETSPEQSIPTIQNLKSKIQNRIVVCLDRDWESIARESGVDPLSGVMGDNLAYVIYTSGSTGLPKGVEITHRSVMNFLTSMRERPGLSGEDVLLSVTTLSFDIAGLELYLPLIVGARVVLVSREVAADGVELLATLARCGATVMQATPATWRLLLETGWDGDGELKLVCGGEALLGELAAELERRGGSLWNLYGPTETTIWSAVAQVEHAERVISIGQPIANTQIYILDSRLQPVPVGVPGELYIGGVGLARGYLGYPELTAERFIPNPVGGEPGARLYRTGDLARYLPDGNIEFLGRIDTQVKVRGFRIELGEIESTLNEHPAVRETVVRADEAPEFEADYPKSKARPEQSPRIAKPKSSNRLVAYVVAKQGHDPTSSDLRGFLKQKLPEYMVPSAFVMLDALPLTPNGKVDRKALPTPGEIRPDLEEIFVAPRTAVEKRLASIWAKLLGLNQVGIHDSFFDLGGHSLLSVRLFAEIEKEFGRRIPLSSLFQQGTIEHLASLIDQRNPSTSEASLVTIQSKGSRSPFFCVHELFGDVLCYMNLARHLGEDQPFYALQARGLDGREEPFTDIEAMAAYYIEEIRTVQPRGPYALGGLCSGGIVAFEIAQQFRARGEVVDVVALLDSRVPNLQQERAGWEWSVVRDFLSDLPSWLIGSLQLNRSQWLSLIKIKLSATKARLRLSGVDGDRNGASKQIDELGELLQFSQQNRKVAQAQYQALLQYRPHIYSGRLTLFRARMQPLFSAHAPDNGWGHLAAGGLDIRVVPGNHLGMLQEPHVRALAEQLRACLEGAFASAPHENPNTY